MDINERNELVLNHMDLAERMALSKHRNLRFIDVEELKSAAYMGLVDAALKYDKKQCDCFSAYACHRVAGSIRDYLRELCWGTRNNPVKIESMDNIDKFQSDFTCEIFDKVLIELPEMTKEVMRLRYIDGLKVREIAEKIGLHRSRISQLLCDARKVIKKHWLGRESELWAELAL